MLNHLSHTSHFAGEHLFPAVVEKGNGFAEFRKFGLLLVDAGFHTFSGIDAVAPIEVDYMAQEPPCLGLIAEIVFVYQLGMPLHQHISEIEYDVFCHVSITEHNGLLLLSVR